MNLKELTQQMNDLVRHHGWYEPDSPKQQTARNLAISLSLEASEVLEHFQWTDETKDAEGLRGDRERSGGRQTFSGSGCALEVDEGRVGDGV